MADQLIAGELKVCHSQPFEPGQGSRCVPASFRLATAVDEPIGLLKASDAGTLEDASRSSEKPARWQTDSMSLHHPSAVGVTLETQVNWPSVQFER